ncbi:MAG: amidohydrolase family protein [Candidatus Altiarchaeales archaeon]|nr:amidohydrolase family protein [Candidatus Altiarchaeales archaeon]
MESLTLKNVRLEGKKTSIHIKENRIKQIGKPQAADTLIDCEGKAALPGFINCHAHSAMSLMRGYADDLPLQTWLEKHIWPLEAKLTGEDIYWGTRLSCIEMLKSGTTCASDMYWHPEKTYQAFRDSGIRAVVSSVFIDLFDDEKREKQIKENQELMKKYGYENPRIKIAYGPHAPYTASRESLEWIAEESKKQDALVHIHLSETDKEVKDCVKQNKLRPVQYLEELGLLSENLSCAHGVWLSQSEKKILGEHKVNIAHCPTSNMKLAVGGVLDYEGLTSRGANVCLGTDGCASNNNQSMLQSMKTASLIQKHHTNNPTRLPAEKAFTMATEKGAKALKIDAGKIAEGKLADIILVDLKNTKLLPTYNLKSNLVYSATDDCIDTVIVDGEILVRDRHMEGEEEVYEQINQIKERITAEK